MFDFTLTNKLDKSYNFATVNWEAQIEIIRKLTEGDRFKISKSKLFAQACSCTK